MTGALLQPTDELPTPRTTSESLQQHIDRIVPRIDAHIDRLCPDTPADACAAWLPAEARPAPRGAVRACYEEADHIVHDAWTRLAPLLPRAGRHLLHEPALLIVRSRQIA
ncbi:hypothetical protein K388_03898 [Streptomyces sp. KhCrAH-43]|uniref:hypothetical protein n=1 Tax=unclassified Streptomyces TaxID=2593676 RepID=UPI000367C52B|nr:MULTISPECIES: hypothetical protein [unclassified Streptomyces]MYS33359.1 hypothetical protein [Streptomyces sp. SID4920]MYX67442.1 hypothetical protein [Streptomyces sp. SID8373]RAJ57839.1 hypothetical protein K388_03898 [Streptomyces sp. KhCrAH-43]